MTPLSSAGALPLRLVRWWLAELAGLVPARVRRLASADRGVATLWLDDGDPGAAGTARFPGSEADWASLRARERRAGRGRRARRWRLALPDRLALVRARSLPEAMRPNLGDVLRTEVENATPFAPGEVLWGYADAPAGDGEVRVTQAFLKAPVVAGLRAAAERAGFRVASVAVWVGRPDEASTVTVARFGREPSRLGRAVRAVNAALALVLLAAAAAAVARPHLERTRRLDELAREAAGLRREAVREAREAAEARVARERSVVLLRWRRDHLPAVELLRLLTEALPDDAWTSELQAARGGAVRVSGFTRGGAAALLRAVAGVPAFAGARFSAPVTIDRAEGLERFEISVAPAAGGAR